MNAHDKTPSPFSIIAQTFFVVCFLVMLTWTPAEAVAQAAKQRVEENGRSDADRARRTTPTPVIEMTGIAEIESAIQCDQDGGECIEGEARAVQDIIVPHGVGDVQAWLTSMQAAGKQAIPLKSLHVDDVGNLGVGTTTPVGRIHVVSRQEEARDIFLLDDNGNLELGGVLIEASSRSLKENFTPVDGEAVLERLKTVPISMWNYKTDDPAVRHLGPVAQDFYAAFGLGRDAEHIAPLDANGVSLAAVQALVERLEAEEARVATLEQQVATLLQEMAALKAQIRK